MDEEQLSHIFEPLYTTKKEKDRFGLGLSTVYGIVKQNNGNISVDSFPATGTSFFVLWPVSKEQVGDTDNKKLFKETITGEDEWVSTDDSAYITENENIAEERQIRIHMVKHEYLDKKSEIFTLTFDGIEKIKNSFPFNKFNHKRIYNLRKNT